MDKKIEFDRNLYKFGMDWLNGVLPVTDVWEVFETLGKFSSKLRFESWELTNSGMYNYSRRYCLDGKASIQLMFNPVSDEESFTACVPEPKDDKENPIHKTHNNPYVFFSISGDGIRQLHKMGGDKSALNNLLFYFYYKGFRASRFDVYCDIMDKKNTAVSIIQKAFKYFQFPQVGKPTLRTNVQRKASNIAMYRGVDDKGIVYYNCTLGNHGTRFGMFRCYNKRMELLEGRLGDNGAEILNSLGNPDYLWRLEYEMHKENAAACFTACMEEAESNNHILCFENTFASALERVFAIVQPTSLGRGLDSYDYADKWALFCDFVMDNSIHLVQFEPLKYIPMSKSRLHRYLKKNSVFVFSMLTALLLNRSLMEEVVRSGGDKYFQKKKYNELRDELDVPGFMPLFVKSQLNRSIQAMDKWQNPA